MFIVFIPLFDVYDLLSKYFVSLIEIFGFATIVWTKIQLHATHATTNLYSRLRQVAHDIQVHATLRMQHVYMVLIYMLIHTY